MPILPNNTLSNIVNFVNRVNSDVVIEPPLSRAAFNLDSSGVAGFFGGESAVRASATLNILQQRRFLALYNAPGSYEVAKQYSGLLKSKTFDALFPSVDSSPSRILMVDGQAGPETTPLFPPPNTTLSGIGHLGYLIARKVSKETGGEKTNMQVANPAEKTGPQRVTFICLHRTPSQKYDLNRQESECAMIFKVVTMLVSVGGCVACALVADWFCLASIAIGMLANAVACWVIGSGRLYLEYPLPAREDIPGDVVLTSDAEIIFLVGKEGKVRPFTRGRFDLRFKGMHGFAPTPEENNTEGRNCKWDIPMKYLINISILLLLVQFLAQLLLIPQGTLFGQLMFIATLLFSWAYHSYLSSISLDWQTEALLAKLSIDEKTDIIRYPSDTAIEAVVFACLAFRSIHLLRLNPDVAGEMAEESHYRDEAHKEKAAKDAERVDIAFKTLLFALLQGETPALQALRQSLVKKMSRSAIIAYARVNKPSFNFGEEDAAVMVTTGEIKLDSENKQKLARYQGEAEQALGKWRSKFWDRKEMSTLAALYS